MLTLAIRLRQAGFGRLADFLIALEALFSKLSRADRTIRRARASRQRQPKSPLPFVILEGEGS